MLQFFVLLPPYFCIKHKKRSKSVTPVIEKVHNYGKTHPKSNEHYGGGCPGSQLKSFKPVGVTVDSETTENIRTELRQWPVQLHLVNPVASYFQNADVLLAADCVAYAVGNFHSKYLKGKSLAIACPKLDEGQETYINKITQLIDNANINTLTVMIMQVPCCGGLLQIAKIGASKAMRKVPVKSIVVSIEGDVLQEEWV